MLTRAILQTKLELNDEALSSLLMGVRSELHKLRRSYPEKCADIYNTCVMYRTNKALPKPYESYKAYYDEMAELCFRLEQPPERVVPVLFEQIKMSAEIRVPGPDVCVNPEVQARVCACEDEKIGSVRDHVRTLIATEAMARRSSTKSELRALMRLDKMYPAWFKLHVLDRHEALDRSCTDLLKVAAMEYYMSPTLMVVLKELGIMQL